MMTTESTEIIGSSKEDEQTVRVRTGAVYLEVVAGEVSGETSYDISRRETILGRGEQATIRILHSRVSRGHAKIALDVDGIAKIIDLNSTNGTLVNNAKIGVEVLREGDRIDIAGVVSFVIHYEYFQAHRG